MRAERVCSPGRPPNDARHVGTIAFGPGSRRPAKQAAALTGRSEIDGSSGLAALGLCRQEHYFLLHAVRVYSRMRRVHGNASPSPRTSRKTTRNKPAVTETGGLLASAPPVPCAQPGAHPWPAASVAVSTRTVAAPCTLATPDRSPPRRGWQGTCLRRSIRCPWTPRWPGRTASARGSRAT